MGRAGHVACIGDRKGIDPWVIIDAIDNIHKSCVTTAKYDQYTVKTPK
jgi:hypothetical protein